AACISQDGPKWCAPANGCGRFRVLARTIPLKKLTTTISVRDGPVEERLARIHAKHLLIGRSPPRLSRRPFDSHPSPALCALLATGVRRLRSPFGAPPP